MRKPKLTPWFPPGVEPVRKGVYIATVIRSETYYRYWNGANWMIGGDTAELAQRLSTSLIALADPIHWRGLASKPKGSA